MLSVISMTFCSLFVCWIYYQRNRRELLLKIKNIPDAVKNYPIIGAVSLGIGKSPQDIFDLVINTSLRASSTVAKFFFFNKLFIIVKEPKYIHKILSSPHCLEKAFSYSILPFQNGLITSKPALWKSHRKMLSSTFHITLLKNKFMQQLNEVAQLLVSDLQCKVGMNEFNIAPFIFYRSTDLQLKSMSDGVIGKDETHIISENNKKAFKILGDTVVNFSKYFVFFFVQKLFKVTLLGERLMNDSYKTIEPFIEIERRQYIDKIQLGDFEEDIFRKPEMFIPKLAKLVERGYFTDEDVKHHIQTVLFAGSDTVPVAISNCILLLAMNEDVQERCVREIQETIGHQFSNISFDDLTKLELLERTINESMRLISTVPFIGRTCEKDFQLDDTKIIPAGTTILIAIFAVHRSKEYWGNNPNKFNPDNFLPENVVKRPLLSFMPFSYGNRNCIGMKFAQHTLKVFMAYLLVNYKFSTDLKFDDLKFAFGLSILLKNKHMIRIEKRKF